MACCCRFFVVFYKANGGRWQRVLLFGFTFPTCLDSSTLVFCFGHLPISPVFHASVHLLNTAFLFCETNFFHAVLIAVSSSLLPVAYCVLARFFVFTFPFFFPGPLLEHIRRRGCFSEGEVRAVMYEIVEALVFLHHKGKKRCSALGIFYRTIFFVPFAVLFTLYKLVLCWRCGGLFSISLPLVLLLLFFVLVGMVWC